MFGQLPLSFFDKNLYKQGYLTFLTLQHSTYRALNAVIIIIFFFFFSFFIPSSPLSAISRLQVKDSVCLLEETCGMKNPVIRAKYRVG
jgi:hypothetical protein